MNYLSEGVRIIREIPPNIFWDVLAIIVIITLSIVWISDLVKYVANGDQRSVSKLIEHIIWVVVAILLLSYGGSSLVKEINSESYEVEITNDVNFEEFIQEYEIVEQDGTIFKIIKK